MFLEQFHKLYQTHLSRYQMWYPKWCLQWSNNSPIYFMGQTQTKYSTEKHCGDTKNIVAYLCDVQGRKLVPARTPPLSIMSVGLHVFAEATSATITCLYWWKENWSSFSGKLFCVLEDTERFAIVDESDNQMQEGYIPWELTGTSQSTSVCLPGESV